MEVNFENLASDEIAFFKDLALELNTPEDLDHARRVCESVFHALRDIISVEDSNLLISYLPDEIAIIYADTWVSSKERTVYSLNEEFYNAIREHSDSVEIDFPDNAEAKQAVQAVFRVLKGILSNSAFSRIIRQLPGSLPVNV